MCDLNWLELSNVCDFGMSCWMMIFCPLNFDVQLRVNEPIKMMYVAALCDDVLF